MITIILLVSIFSTLVGVIALFRRGIGQAFHVPEKVLERIANGLVKGPKGEAYDDYLVHIATCKKCQAKMEELSQRKNDDFGINEHLIEK